MQPLKAKTIQMDTNELEAYIDSRYETGAQQAELEALETAFAERVSEDENTTEEDLQMSEAHDMGVDLEEWLAIEYYQYLNPNERVGGRDNRDFFNPNGFNDFLSLNLKPGIKRKDIVTAAKDIYEYKTQLIRRQKSKLKFNHIPNRLSKLYKRIDKNRSEKYDIRK